VSTVQSNDLNPIWNEHFEFIVEDADTQSVTVKIYDDDGIQESDLIGCVQVSLKDLQPGKVKDVWLKLVKDLEIQRDKKDRGQVSSIFQEMTPYHHFSLGSQVGYITFLFGFHFFS
jgi:Ca2+-dependent lipid-binding protein